MSLLSKLINPQKYNEKIKKAIDKSKNPVEVLEKYAPNRILPSTYDYAFIQAKSEYEKHEIARMIKANCISRLLNIDLILEILKSNPFRFYNLDFNYINCLDESVIKKIYLTTEESALNLYKIMRPKALANRQSISPYPDIDNEYVCLEALISDVQQGKKSLHNENLENNL